MGLSAVDDAFELYALFTRGLKSYTRSVPEESLFLWTKMPVAVSSSGLCGVIELISLTVQIACFASHCVRSVSLRSHAMRGSY